MIDRLALAVAGVLLAERAAKHAMVVRFFAHEVPAVATTPLVSILQPILSGDPTLEGCLEQNLLARSRYPVEFIWLVDDDDVVAQAICRRLIERYPTRLIRLIELPAPPERTSPKMIKLIAGSALAEGEIICVLDDDTVLPDGGLEQCLPYLDQPEVGLAFGLPFYTNFSNLWSSLVAAFVNSHSLMTYVPPTYFGDPFTINGMFFAIKRDLLRQIGGFEGLQTILADDFAVAQRVRSHGYRLAQTPLRHGISTTVRGPRHYLNLLQRWFIFPRESLLRHLAPRELALTYGLVLLPTLAPLLLMLAAGWRKSLRPVLLLYLVYDYVLFAHINRAYLGNATPWRRSWWVPVLALILPAQLVVALLSPQRINWRGHIMQVEPGGGLRIVKRRSGD